MSKEFSGRDDFTEDQRYALDFIQSSYEPVIAIVGDFRTGKTTIAGYFQTHSWHPCALSSGHHFINYKESALQRIDEKREEKFLLVDAVPHLTLDDYRAFCALGFKRVVLFTNERVLIDELPQFELEAPAF